MYPTENELKRIKEWDVGDPMGLLKFIENLWFYPDRFILEGKRVLRLYLSTAGWSGNEEIIEALEENIFWDYAWQKSTVGGHYWFKFKLQKK